MLGILMAAEQFVTVARHERGIDALLTVFTAIGAAVMEQNTKEGHYGLGMTVIAFLTLVFRAWQGERDRKRLDRVDRVEEHAERRVIVAKVEGQAKEVEELRLTAGDLARQREAERQAMEDMRRVRDLDRESIERAFREIETLRRLNEELKAKGEAGETR